MQKLQRPRQRRQNRKMGNTMVEAKEQIHKLDGFTGYLEKNGEKIAKTLDSATDDLDRILKNLNSFSEKINDPRGSLGQLASDLELYQHVNRAVRNIDELTRQLKPILDDVRVFTDKIARHPGELGVSPAWCSLGAGNQVAGGFMRGELFAESVLRRSSAGDATNSLLLRSSGTRSAPSQAGIALRDPLTFPRAGPDRPAVRQRPAASAQLRSPAAQWDRGWEAQ